MSKVSKPRPIRRQGPNGPQEINPLTSGFIPTESEIITACLFLGQTEMQARSTLRDYLEEMIDESDAKLLHEEIKKIRGQNLLTGVIETKIKKNGISSIEAAHINPRDPVSGAHPQKVIRRDQSGKIIGIDNL
jgi:hypothetical protein